MREGKKCPFAFGYCAVDACTPNCKHNPNYTELKPCPFCGGEASQIKNERPRLHRPARNGNYYIYCGECELLFGYDEDYGGQFDTEAEATEAWNKRIK